MCGIVKRRFVFNDKMAAAEKAAERERKLQETAAGKAQAEQLNADLEARIARLESILRRGLDREAAIDLNAMLRTDEFPPLDLGTDGVAAPRPIWSTTARAAARSLVSSVQSLAMNSDWLRPARNSNGRNWSTSELRWRAKSGYGNIHHAMRQLCWRIRHDIARHNSRIAQISAGVPERDRESVQYYLELVLAGTLLPDDVPHAAEVAYSPRGEQAVVRFELPSIDVIPGVESYTYVATTATLREKKRPAAQIAQLYRSVISQITLLYMRNIFDSDPELDNVELGGHVRSVNPATGQREYPCLISIATDRSTYLGLNLRDVEPDVCLRHLNALVSHHPQRPEPVTPIRDFDLARYSFVEAVDVVASLDSRTDLTKISPTEFEHFVRQLFEASGLEGWTTERSGDDGVDAVVINRDPMVGGLTIVQAKRYTNVIGVSHIRELVGAMDEKRAGRGILVTTSWFASGCKIKARDNGRIQLIEGSELVHLVKEHLHKDVLVAPPAARSRARHQ